MDRGMAGVFPRPPRLEEESYLEFVTSFRKYMIRSGFQVMAANGEAEIERSVAAGEINAPADGDQLPLGEIQQVFHKIPVVRTWQRFVRSQQEMMWRGIRASFVTRADDYLDRMDAAEKANPENIHYDPEFQAPDYTRCEIHCQPGGYTDDPIGGIVVHYGSKVFYEGSNDQNEVRLELAEKTTAPADGKIANILDIGCSIGQTTTVLKQLYPEAEVWGLDVGRPMIRYAHMLATEADMDVHFKQALAEDSGFDDGYFDMVLSYILFHEVPVSKMIEILAETYRILRPGGVLSIFEFPNNNLGSLPASYRFMIENDSRDNCEPYSPGFVASDFRGLLEEAGFVLEDGPKIANDFLQSIVAIKPA